MYKEPENVKSSYGINNIGHTIYTVVMALNPTNVIEIGTLGGYSAICIGQALRDLGGDRKLFCYDLWDEYEYNKCDIDETRENIEEFGLDDHITLIKSSLDDVLFRLTGDYPAYFIPDLMHIDVSNNGEIIRKVSNSLSAYNVNIMFEGGTKERDNVEWMKKYDKKPIIGCCKYRVIDYRFPGLSML